MKIKVRQSSDLEAALNEYDQAIRDWGLAAYVVIDQINDRDLVARKALDNEKLWQLYGADCLDKGLEPTGEGFKEWMRVEYPELLKGRKWADEVNKEPPF